MRYRQLGATGIRVSEIGFGAWGIGGNVGDAVAYGPADEGESHAALRRAVELGINFFDTSDLYGSGHSEEVLGESLQPLRPKLVLATKVGFRDSTGAQDFSPTYIEAALERSLRRLRSDYVDLYQLHDPPIELLKTDASVVRTLENLRAAGKIRAYGISLRTPDDGLAAVRDLGFGCLQFNFNMLDQRAEDNGLLDLCDEQGVGVIVRTPLVFGFLTGRYTAQDNFDKSDHRHRRSPKQLDRWAGAYRLFTQLMNHPKGETPSQFALRFCLSHRCVSTVIPGMLTREHVVENAMASDLGPLPGSVVRTISNIYRENSFFVGRD
ncbi:MAG: aldo/keto reductase [Gammaproteobacteria bacterium]|nr:aldo/keto reductase [Gammaproteobacteria bacterium]MDH3411898.1 aldo/keto reductase [Gammaproteobacteria bacterium]